MNIIKDDAAQTSAEFLLLFGGVIVVVVAFAIFYSQYISGLGNALNGTYLTNINNNITSLSSKFS